MSRQERERKRAGTISSYMTMLATALATVPEKKRTGELIFRIQFTDGGFHSHSMKITEDVKFYDQEI